jgi:hypothetical protein
MPVLFVNMSSLHGICGLFYQEDSIWLQNACGFCFNALQKRIVQLKYAQLTLPYTLTAQQVRETNLAPKIKNDVIEIQNQQFELSQQEQQ